MVIYFILLFFVVFTIFIGRRTWGGKVRPSMYFVAFSAMVLVAGIRSRYVGTDAGNYVDVFKMTLSFNDVLKTSLEPGYFFLCWVSHAFSDDYISIFTVVAFVTTLCFVLVIRKYSVDPVISTFILIAGGYYFISFNGFRQGLANALFFLAYGAVFRRNFVQYSICVIVAMLFHKTAIIAWPAYFLITRKNTLKLNIAMFVLAIFAVYFFNYIIEIGGILDSRYVQYGAITESGLGLVSLVFLMCLCSFFIFFRSRVINHKSMYDTLLNMFILATIISVVSFLNGTGASGVRRLAMYFSMSAILLWPIVYTNIKEARGKQLFLYLFVSLYLLYYAMTLQAFGHMIPYKFNPIVLKWWTNFL